MLNRREFLCCAGAVALTACAPDKSREGASAAKPAPAAPRQAALQVTVWHDLICPWCRIGLHNLERVLSSWNGPPVKLELRPYLLNPDTPAEGVDLRRELESKYGAGTSGRMFERVTQAGAQAGVQFAWDKVTVSPSTVGGHALLDAAPEAKRRPLLEALHRAYFEEGVNLGSADALVALATPVGLAEADVRRIVTDQALLAKVRAEANEAVRLGIRGVPNFRIGQATLNGAQPPAAIEQALRAAQAG